jgi:hypothetical protein
MGGRYRWVVWCDVDTSLRSLLVHFVGYHCTVVLINYTNKEFRSLEGSELIEADRPRLPMSPDCFVWLAAVRFLKLTSAALSVIALYRAATPPCGRTPHS